METFYNKLVRDNIPDIITNNGGTPYYHEVDGDQYWAYLLKKDTEELEEIKTASSKEDALKELADKYELLKAMALHLGYTMDDVCEVASKKASKNGAFEKRLVLDKVIE